MRSFFALLRSLTIPYGAGANDPAIVIGRDVPAELAAFYAPDTVVACEIYRENSTTYVYDALVDPVVGLTFRATGAIEGVGFAIAESFRVQPVALGSVRIIFSNRQDITNTGGFIKFNPTDAAATEGAANDITIHGDHLSLKNADYPPQNPGAGTTTSGSYANLPGNPSATINKKYASTRLKVTAFVETFSTLANTSVDLGAAMGATGDVTIWHHVHNPANVHDMYGGVRFVTGMGAGSHTITGRWRRPAGGGTVTMNADDYFCLAVEEVT